MTEVLTPPGIEALKEAAYNKASRTPSAEIATHLQGVLGQRLTALITSVNNPRTVGAWARGQTPQPDNLERLIFTYQVVWLLLHREADSTVRAWFMGMNPRLGDQAPAEVIAEKGRSPEVLRAACAFLGA